MARAASLNEGRRPLPMAPRSRQSAAGASSVARGSALLEQGRTTRLPANRSGRATRRRGARADYTERCQGARARVGARLLRGRTGAPRRGSDPAGWLRAAVTPDSAELASADLREAP